MAIIVSGPTPLRSLTFFADSSSRDRDYMVAGGFAVSGNRIAEIERTIAELRERYNISEFHWAEYKGGSREQGYKELVDYAFSLVRNKHAAFHVLIAKFKCYRHKRKAGENRDTSVNRMYYQLCLHRIARFYGKERAIQIRLDQGNDSADICSMRGQLCAAAYKTYKTRANCVRSIAPVCSKKSGIVQMADVIIGAIAAKRNEVTHTSAKGPLADYVLAASGQTSWQHNTADHARLLTVWNHKSGGGSSRP